MALLKDISSSLFGLERASPEGGGLRII